MPAQRTYPRPAMGFVWERITETPEEARECQAKIMAEIRKMDRALHVENIGPEGFQMTMIPIEPNWTIVKAALCYVYQRLWCEEHNEGACMSVAPDAVLSNYLAGVLLGEKEEE